MSIQPHGPLPEDHAEVYFSFLGTYPIKDDSRLASLTEASNVSGSAARSRPLIWEDLRDNHKRLGQWHYNFSIFHIL